MHYFCSQRIWGSGLGCEDESHHGHCILPRIYAPWAKSSRCNTRRAVRLNIHFRWLCCQGTGSASSATFSNTYKYAVRFQKLQLRPPAWMFCSINLWMATFLTNYTWLLELAYCNPVMCSIGAAGRCWYVERIRRQSKGWEGGRQQQPLWSSSGSPEQRLLLRRAYDRGHIWEASWIRWSQTHVQLGMSYAISGLKDHSSHYPPLHF